jgi:hypothetical protein
MHSPLLNQRYHYEGEGAGKYPFRLYKNDFVGIKKSLDESRQYIGTTFPGSFKGVEGRLK